MVSLIAMGLFIVALAAVVKGSDLVVDAAARIAKKLGVGEFLIGLTIIALGTSLPEFAVTLSAAFQGESELILGTIVGSNIANLALIVGLSSIFVTVKANKQIYSRDALLLLAASMLFFLFALNGSIGWLEGLFFLLMFALYLTHFIAIKRRFKTTFHVGKYAREIFEFKSLPTLKPQYSYSVFSPGMDYFTYKELVKESLYQSRRFFTIVGDILRDESAIIRFLIVQLGLLAIGFTLLIVGAETMVDSLSAFPIPPVVVGVVVVALGTSLPELIVAITALRKGFTNIMIGNIIGSVIANTLLIGGVAAVISPLVITPTLLWVFLPALLFVSWMFTVFLRNDFQINRVEGLTLLAFYCGFVIYTLWLL
jgi:cation:H+ antiporter